MAHLLDTYAIATQSKVGKPYILEKYFPLPFNKYIVFAPISKPAKNYSYYQDVLEILLPILKEQQIEVIQIGAVGEQSFGGCYNIQGKTSLNQVYHILKNSLLFFGADTYASHFSSALGIPSVVLISNNWSNNVRGYWHQDKQIILEPDRTKRKPSFSLDEPFPKQINEIKAEKIAESVCKLLGLKFDFPYETIYVGESYHTKILETIPNSVTNISNLGVDSIVLRMDYQFNDTILQHQMQHCPVSIITDQPINIEILRNYKPRIRQLFYVITENHSPAFAAAVQKLCIPLQMFSYLPEEKLNEFKLEYLDIATILPKNVKTKEVLKENKDIDVQELFYKSSKITLDSGKIFGSKSAWLKKQPIANINDISPLIDDQMFFEDLEYCTVLKKK